MYHNKYSIPQVRLIDSTTLKRRHFHRDIKANADADNACVVCPCPNEWHYSNQFTKAKKLKIHVCVQTVQSYHQSTCYFAVLNLSLLFLSFIYWSVSPSCCLRSSFRHKKRILFLPQICSHGRSKRGSNLSNPLSIFLHTLFFFCIFPDKT